MREYVKIEEWKPVVGYEGLYEVSSEGRVLSLGRFQKVRNNGRMFRKEQIMKLKNRPGGYLGAHLCKNCKHKIHSVHRLVAEAFIPNPEGKEQVNHKNGIKTDNRVSNLEWVTKSENALHMNRVLGKRVAKEQPVRCVETGVVYKSISEAAKAIGVNQSLIGNVAAKRKSYKTAKGYHWEYVYYNWKKYKCNRGAQEEGNAQEHFFRDCPIGIHKEDDESVSQ